jgi:pimeloyl-ACP methyl ester carboxylesterase
MATTFLLIPGAWHTASSWFPVARRLREAGAGVEIVELPGQRTTDNEAREDVRLADAVDAVLGRLRDRDLRDVVLVGHSLGGYVIGGALAAAVDRVRNVIYCSAHIPVEGLSMSEAFAERMEPLRIAAETSPDGSVPVPDPELIREVFVPGASADFQQLVGDLLVPTPGAYFLEPVDRPTRPGDHALPFTYVLGEGDLILPPPAGQFAEMLGVDPVLVPGGHESLLTHPDALAATFLDLAG